MVEVVRLLTYLVDLIFRYPTAVVDALRPVVGAVAGSYLYIASVGYSHTAVYTNIAR